MVRHAHLSSKMIVPCIQLYRVKEEGTLGHMCRTPYPGGAPANVAAALGRLGVKVAFVSALGQDDLARQMLSLLKGISPSKRTDWEHDSIASCSGPLRCSWLS